MTLDYRSPGTGPPRVQQVAEHLAMEEGLDWVMIAGKIVLGLPLSAIGPLGVVWLLNGLDFTRPSRAPEDSLKLFLLVSLVTIPFLFWFRRRTQREFLWESMQIEPGGWDPAWGFHSYVAPITAVFAAALEALLFGPGLIWSVIDQFRFRDTPDEELRISAAGIVVEMLDTDGPLPIASLPKEGRRTQEQVAWALGYLERRGWICIARRRDRVWLGSSIRKELADLA